MAAGNSAINKDTRLYDSFFANMVNTRYVNASVVQKRPKYYLISALTQMLGGAEQTGARKFEIYNQGQLDIAEPTSSTTTAANGTDLVVTLSNPDSNVVRVNDHVYDQQTGEHGVVISTEAGQVTVKPWDVGSFDSSTFDSGHYMSVMGDISPDEGSQGKETLNHDIQAEYNYCGVQVESQAISRNALGQKTWTEAGPDQWWSLSAETNMVARFSKNREKGMLVNPRQEKDGRHTSGGLDWYISNYGNTFSLSAQPTENDFQDIMRTIIREAGTGTEELTLIGGINAIDNFQNNVVGKYVQPVGSDNTLERISGQPIKGIDGYAYQFLGVRINLINYSLLDDKYVFPQVSTITNELKSSDTLYILDTTPVEGSLGEMSPFKTYYYSDKQMYYWYVPGSISVNSADPSQIMSAGYAMSASLYDGMQAVILCDEGYEFRYPQRHGKMFLSK